MIKTSEHQEQCALVERLHWQYPDLPWYAVPNGGQRDIRVAAKLKKEGVRPGVLDLVFPVARKGYHGFYLEMKIKGNKLTDSQKWFIQKLTEQGYLCDVAWSGEEGWQKVKEYMG